MLKYGIIAKVVELMCFKCALNRFTQVCTKINIKEYKKETKREYK
ncbi:hypothetical protein [Eubacterium sp.]